MHFCWATWFAVLCLAGIQGLTAGPSPLLSEGEIDTISDESSDIIITGAPPESSEEESEEEDEPATAPPLTDDPKIYGMNIGLHYILRDINIRMDMEDRVHLESLIKVLVLTHKIEKSGGTLNEDNKADLKRMVRLFPEALREALKN